MEMMPIPLTGRVFAREVHIRLVHLRRRLDEFVYSAAGFLARQIDCLHFGDILWTARRLTDARYTRNGLSFRRAKQVPDL